MYEKRNNGIRKTDADNGGVGLYEYGIFVVNKLYVNVYVCVFIRLLQYNNNNKKHLHAGTCRMCLIFYFFISILQYNFSQKVHDCHRVYLLPKHIP